MIICGCKEAKLGCVDTCLKWKGKTKPTVIMYVAEWEKPKEKKNE